MIVIKDLIVKLKEFKLVIPELRVGRGEYLVVMGPSGVGKTVLIHTLVGFIKPLRGSIIVDGRDVTNEPPERRGLALIPQDYGLFPHMSVYDNIAYGLRIRGLSKDLIDGKVREVARTLEIEGILSKYPHEISGGEQQRVALARALVVEPKVLLMDEPLSSLDPRLRIKSIEFLKNLHRRLGFTAIHITHNLLEALELGDEVAYIEGGELMCVLPPREFIRSRWGREYLRELLMINKYLST